MHGDRDEPGHDAPWAAARSIGSSARSTGTIASGPAVEDSEPDPGAPGPALSRNPLRRRSRWLALALVAGLAAVGTGSWAGVRDRTPAPEAEAPLGGVVELLTRTGSYGLPTRGSLAGDEAFVDALRRLPWTGSGAGSRSPVPVPPVDRRRVVFAGEVPGGRVALVVGRTGVPEQGRDTGGPVAHVWFTGRPGAGAAQMAPAGPPRRSAGDRPQALVNRLGRLVLVTAPGDTVEVSERPEHDADGVRRRTWTPAVVEDGVAVVRLGGPPAGSTSPVTPHGAVIYRVLRGGAPVARSEPDREVRTRRDVTLGLSWVRPPTGNGAGVAQDAAVDLLARLGSDENESSVDGHWAGPVPGIPGATAAVLTVTTPSGALVVRAGMRVPVGGFEVDVVCGVEVRAAGAPPASRTYAAACTVPDLARTGSARSHLLVVAPPTAASVRTYDGYGDFVSEHAAADGVVVIPRPPGTMTVEGVTARGVLLGRSRLMAVDRFLRT